MFLLLVDAHSKWPEAVPMQSTTATKTVECLRTIFARHGLPEQLVSDNGPQFVSEQFQDFLQGNGIQHIRSAPYHPSTNGLVERFVHTFKHAMRASETSLSLNERLQCFLLTYRTTPHATTRESPSMFLHGRPLRTRLDLLRPDTACRVEANSSLRPQTLLHSHVSLRSVRRFLHATTALATTQWLPGSIATRSQSGLHYEVQVSPGILWRRHNDQLRSTSIAPVPLEPASEPALVPAQEEERGNAKAEVQATLSSQPPATGNAQFPSEVPPTPTSPAPVENQASATTPAPTAERRYPQREQRAPQRLNY